MYGPIKPELTILLSKRLINYFAVVAKKAQNSNAFRVRIIIELLKIGRTRRLCTEYGSKRNSGSPTPNRLKTKKKRKSEVLSFYNKGKGFA